LPNANGMTLNFNYLYENNFYYKSLNYYSIEMLEKPEMRFLWIR